LSPLVKRKSPTRPEIRRVINGITEYLLSKADPKRANRLWPSDYRLFSTNPLSVAYGALGTALFLKTALGELPEEARQWIEQRPISSEAHPPGLFVGLSGIAWALEELGLTDKARTAIDLAYK